MGGLNLIKIDGFLSDPYMNLINCFCGVLIAYMILNRIDSYLNASMILSD